MNTSKSFIQDQAHVTKSSRFQAVKPAMVAEKLKEFGFNLVSLKTGHARSVDRADHQTTLARYRSQSEMKINGLNLDIVFKIPHLYGSLEGYLGTYRVVCSNGLVMGEKFDSIKIKHLGEPLKELEYQIPRLVAQEARLVETIKAMQSTNLTHGQIMEFATAVAMKRIGQDSVNVFTWESLLKSHRSDDHATDLFTVLNVIQENSLRSSMPYQVYSREPLTGRLITRNMSTRRVNENSSKALEINQTIWNVAEQFLAAA